MEKKSRPYVAKKVAVRSSNSQLRKKTSRASKRGSHRQPERRYGRTEEFDGLFDPPRAVGDKRQMASSAALSTLGSGFSWFKTIGGFDGILSFMNKMNQMYRMFQQFSPMFKLFGLFGGSKAATASIGTYRPRVSPKLGGKHHRGSQPKRHAQQTKKGG
jgi:hypothetical protein